MQESPCQGLRYSSRRGAGRSLERRVRAPDPEPVTFTYASPAACGLDPHCMACASPSRLLWFKLSEPDKSACFPRGRRQIERHSREIYGVERNRKSGPGLVSSTHLPTSLPVLLCLSPYHTLRWPSPFRHSFFPYTAVVAFASQERREREFASDKKVWRKHIPHRLSTYSPTPASVCASSPTRPVRIHLEVCRPLLPFTWVIRATHHRRRHVGRHGHSKCT